ncbi:hypothetical protein HK104_007951 [Borealophlyctis nickersoniae]|nr:hypothetical protein HK104_007951 [Borealophlyctis nickersoniae]
MDGFMKVLTDRHLFEEFKAFAATDLCVESPLFFEAYQELQVVAANACARSRLLPHGTIIQSSPLATSATLTQPVFQTIRSKLRHASTSTAPSPHTPTGSTAAPAAAGNTSNQSLTDHSSTGGSKVLASLVVPEEARPKFRAFYDTYISEGAPFEVNLPAETRRSILDAFESSTESLTVGVFDKAKDEVVRNMFFGSFPTFLKDAKSRVRTPSLSSPATSIYTSTTEP